MSPCHVTETVVSDYDFKFFKIIKIIVINYSFKLKVKTIVGDYGFNHLKKIKIVVINYSFNYLKKFKTIVFNYNLMTWKKCISLSIILKRDHFF